jgi:small subunit ribosomal protein S7
MSQTQFAQPQEIKLFQKWSFKDITVKDIGLQRYLNLTPMVAPHSMGRHEHQRFRKAKVNIVERLINGLMRSGKNAGKKAKATNIVKEAFEIINIRTGKNPIEVLVKQLKTALHAKTQHVSAWVESSTTYQLTLHHNAESTLQYAT